MISSKPRHGDPIFEIRGDKVIASPQFQRWMDDVTSQLNALQDSLDALDQRVEALEYYHP